MIHKVITFKTRNKEYCWRAMARNGREIFRASETYKSKYYNRKQADNVAFTFVAEIISDDD